MQRFQGLIGIVLILGMAYLFSNNKKRINLRLVVSGIFLQLLIAVLVFKVAPVESFFEWLGHGIEKLESFARQGVSFVYGGVVVEPATGSGKFVNYVNGGFVFAFNIAGILTFICALVAVLYYFNIIQTVVSWLARGMNFIMRVSGAEALSNIASTFVGQVEAQVMIRPYLPGMTMSELLASMTGSLACISGGILIVYADMGTRAGLNITPTLIAASLMAAPGALVISKIVFPETEESQTMGRVKLPVKHQYKNVIDAVAHGAGDGFKIALNVIAMLIGFIAIIACLDYLLEKIGLLFHLPFQLNLGWIFGKIFYPFAWSMGVPQQDIANSATLLGQKLSINEFIAFNNLTNHSLPIISPKGLLITTVAICGFANFSSVGMLIGGISEIAPERRPDLARLGLKALFCGTLASYLSATIAGILL